MISELFVFVEAHNLATKGNQTVGESNDYYVTLQQLESILKAAGRGVGSLTTREKLALTDAQRQSQRTMKHDQD